MHFVRCLGNIILFALKIMLIFRRSISFNVFMTPLHILFLYILFYLLYLKKILYFNARFFIWYIYKNFLIFTHTSLFVLFIVFTVHFRWDILFGDGDFYRFDICFCYIFLHVYLISHYRHPLIWKHIWRFCMYNLCVSI